MSLIVKSLCLLITLWQCLPESQTTPADTSFVLKVKKPHRGVLRIIEYSVPRSADKQKPPKKTKRKKCKKKSSKLIKWRSDPLPTQETPTNFLLKLLKEQRIICIGSLITQRLVLSSTNCFEQRPTVPSLYELQDSSNRLYSIQDIILGTSVGLHLAGILLAADLEAATMQPVPLCSRQLKLQDNVHMYMTRLRINFLRTQIVQNAVCKESYLDNESVFITEHMLCAQNSNVLQDCELTTRGDPLLHEGQLCGINIYGPNCMEDAVNGDLYADIFKALDFIADLVEKQ